MNVTTPAIAADTTAFVSDARLFARPGFGSRRSIVEVSHSMSAPRVVSANLRAGFNEVFRRCALVCGT